MAANAILFKGIYGPVVEGTDSDEHVRRTPVRWACFYIPTWQQDHRPPRHPHFSISDGETWDHLAIVDNQLFIRDLNGLAAYRFIRPPK